MKSADLHIHTIFSDGSFSVKEIIEMAKTEGLDCISITDHDSVDAYLKTGDFLQDNAIEIISGLEITCEYNSKEIHILGYFIDFKNQMLLKNLQILRQRRILRIKKMIKKLNALGIDIEFEELISSDKTSSLTRLHLANLLLKKGLVNSIMEAFNRYIGENAPCYVGGFHFSPEEAIRLINQVRGIPVLAHPYSIENLEEILENLIKNGLRGIEVYYPEHSLQHINYYKNLADKYGLLITGGSDFHGNCRPQIKLGCVRITYDLVEKLKEQTLVC